jgi:hypothetical protein
MGAHAARDAVSAKAGVTGRRQDGKRWRGAAVLRNSACDAQARTFTDDGPLSAGALMEIADTFTSCRKRRMTRSSENTGALASKAAPVQTHPRTAPSSTSLCRKSDASSRHSGVSALRSGCESSAFRPSQAASLTAAGATTRRTSANSLQHVIMRVTARSRHTEEHAHGSTTTLAHLQQRRKVCVGCHRCQCEVRPPSCDSGHARHCATTRRGASRPAVERGDGCGWADTAAGPPRRSWHAPRGG